MLTVQYYGKIIYHLHLNTRENITIKYILGGYQRSPRGLIELVAKHNISQNNSCCAPVIAVFNVMSSL